MLCGRKQKIAKSISATGRRPQCLWTPDVGTNKDAVAVCSLTVLILLFSTQSSPQPATLKLNAFI